MRTATVKRPPRVATQRKKAVKRTKTKPKDPVRNVNITTAESEKDNKLDFIVFNSGQGDGPMVCATAYTCIYFP